MRFVLKSLTSFPGIYPRLAFRHSVAGLVRQRPMGAPYSPPTILVSPGLNLYLLLGKTHTRVLASSLWRKTLLFRAACGRNIMARMCAEGLDCHR